MRKFTTRYVSSYAWGRRPLGSTISSRNLAQVRFATSSARTQRSRYWIGWGAAVVTSYYVGYYVVAYNWTPPGLNPDSFTPYTMRSKERVSSTASIFTLIPTAGDSGQNLYKELWKNSLWSVQAKQPQLQIARNYTPLPPSVKEDGLATDPTALRILIRHELKGEMSGYLHRLPLDATIDLRGPYEHLSFKKETDSKESHGSVIFCAGGTGIAPAMQCAYAILASHEAGDHEAEDLPKMHILWASRKREDCLGGTSDTVQARGIWEKLSSSPAPPQAVEQKNAIVEELEALKQRCRGRLTVDYFVDEERSSIDGHALQRSLATVGAEQKLDVRGKSLVLVSGPDGFISYIAGPKVVQDGIEVQGPLGGLMKGVASERDINVIKL